MPRGVRALRRGDMRTPVRTLIAGLGHEPGLWRAAAVSRYSMRPFEQNISRACCAEDECTVHMPLRVACSSRLKETHRHTHTHLRWLEEINYTLHECG